MSIKTMLLIVNPVAGQGDFVPNFFEVVDRFAKAGFEVTVYPTSGPRHAYQLTLERAAAFDYLVCSGGDGTLDEVVDALMLLERRPLLGYIPCGSTNDFAATHELSADAFLGAQTVIDGRTISIDVGCFQNSFFTYVAAFGIFTDVSYGTPQGLKNMMGHAAYILEGVKKLGNIRHWHCRVELEDEVIEDDFILGMISNSKSVGGFALPEGLDIRLDDGLFELILLRRIQSLEEMGTVISVLMGGNDSHEASFIVRSIRKARIICDQPLDWSTDGEYGGSFKVTDIAVRYKAIDIIVPAPGETEDDKKRRG